MGYKKINWFNLIKIFLFVVSSLVSLYMMFIFIVNGLSWFGIYCAFMSSGIAGLIYTDLKEQIEKMKLKLKNLRVG